MYVDVARRLHVLLDGVKLIETLWCKVSRECQLPMQILSSPDLQPLILPNDPFTTPTKNRTVVNIHASSVVSCAPAYARSVYPCLLCLQP